MQCELSLCLYVDKEMLIMDFEHLGIKEGDAVLVHSSLASIGCVEGGADTVIDTLLECVGDRGTVLMPTLTGSAELSTLNPPVFDVRNTPCWTGTIPETFRKRAGAVRSLQPTHSVAAIGAQARMLTAGAEEADMPCGRHTPYEKLARMPNGRILMIGCGLESCTMLHHVEERAGIPEHLQDEPAECTVIDYDGREIKVRTYLHRYGLPRNFPIMHDVYIERGIMRTGIVGEADALLIKAGEMVEYTLTRLEEDPLLLYAKTAEG